VLRNDLMKATHAITTTLLAVTALLAAPAHAADGHIYPASSCAPNTSYDDVTHYWGRLKNNTASSINFECPVARDNLLHQVNKGDVWVINQNYNQSLSCTLGMVEAHTGSTSSVSLFFSTRSTGVVSSAPQKLASFGALGHIGNGYLHMVCSVPGKYSGQESGVVSYLVEENN
jgi:hypothetical protein